MTYSPHDIKRLMRDRLPPGVQKLIELVGAEAERIGVPIYLVGGFVRDLLLDRPNVDLDFVIEGDAAAFVKQISGHYGGAPHLASTGFFGTVKWFLDGSWAQTLGQFIDRDDEKFSADFARARRETYADPGALPTVDPIAVTIEIDLKRRDFTINALAIQLPNAELIDPFGGADDLLLTRLIRILHERSFVDDPTRIFRAVRFEQRLDFHIDAPTESLIVPALPIINDISGERIRHELDLIFQEAEPENAMARLAQLGVLRQIDPQLRFDTKTADTFRAVRQRPPDLGRLASRRLVNPSIYWAIWASFMDPPAWKRLQARLPFSNDITVTIEQTLRVVRFVRSNTQQLKTSEFVKHIEPFDRTHAQVAAWLILDQPDTQIRNYIAEHMDTVRPELTGNDLIAMGLQPGPAFGTILRKLRDARLDGEISTVEEERALVGKWIEQGLFEQ